MTAPIDLETILRQSLQQFRDKKTGGLCPTCGKMPGLFRDELSQREYAISGLCQACQDHFFNADLETEDAL